MPKTVIHVFHDDPCSLATAAHLSERIRQVKRFKDDLIMLGAIEG